MAIANGVVNLDEPGLITALQDARKKLDSTGGEAILDLTSVRRVNASAIRALEEFVHVAEEKSAKVVLRGTNVDVYKVLKLVKLTRRVSFVN